MYFLILDQGMELFSIKMVLFIKDNGVKIESK
jgi:hypothetical protein